MKYSINIPFTHFPLTLTPSSFPPSTLPVRCGLWRSHPLAILFERMWCLYLPISWNYPGLFSSGRVNFITVNLRQIPSYEMQIPRNLMQTCARYSIMFGCGCCSSNICVCVLLSSNISLESWTSVLASLLYNFPALSETYLTIGWVEIATVFEWIGDRDGLDYACLSYASLSPTFPHPTTLLLPSSLHPSCQVWSLEHSTTSLVSLWLQSALIGHFSLRSWINRCKYTLFLMQTILRHSCLWNSFLYLEGNL